MTENEKKKKVEKVIIERKYSNEVTPIQAILPIIMDDLKRKYKENHRIENGKDNK